MKRVALVILFVVTLCVLALAGIPRLSSFVVGMPETVYLANETKVQNILLQVWGRTDTPENRVWVDSGWLDYVKTANTNMTVKIYNVSQLQIKDSCTTSNIAKWKAILNNNPNVKVAKTTNFKQLMLDYGLEPKYKYDWEAE